MAQEQNIDKAGPVIVGYGFKRMAKTLKNEGAERVWLDKEEHRPELASMLDKIHLTLRPGDILLVVSPADLGKRKKSLPRRLADLGVAVQVRGRDPVICKSADLLKDWLSQGDSGRERVNANKGGRPSKFRPTPEQDAVLRALWHDPEVKRATVVSRAEGFVGHPVNFIWLRYRYRKSGDSVSK